MTEPRSNITPSPTDCRAHRPSGNRADAVRLPGLILTGQAHRSLPHVTDAWKRS